MKIGVYEIVRMIDGKRYIGSSKNMPVRQRINFNCLVRGDHHNKPLQSAWSETNGLGFLFGQVAQVEKLSDAQAIEEVEIAKGNCFNINISATSRRGVKHSVDTIEKQRLAARVRSASKNGRAQLKSLQTPRNKRKATLGKKRYWNSAEGKERMRRISALGRAKRWGTTS